MSRDSTKVCPAYNYKPGKLGTNGPSPNIASYLNQGIVPLVNYYYDYSPQDLESPRRPYVETYFPAPGYIRPGIKVKVAFTTDHLHPAFYGKLPTYEIDDVEGYKIFLKPLFRLNMSPSGRANSLYSKNESPFEVPFAYTQTKIGDLPQRLVRGYYWGYGAPAAFLKLA